MCIFSGPVDSVSTTSIFARSALDGRQYLVYSMTVSAPEELAMILPLPVPHEASDDAVEFIDLSGYPAFFSDLDRPFLKPVPAGRRQTPDYSPTPTRRAPLPVIEVGDFEASFVPTVGDFDRLDARFRLPEKAWSQLPGYERFGFAVFKLKKGNQRVHPMALEFPRADPTSLFFPTIHVHDGTVHPEATFDHALYCQRSRGAQSRPPQRWETSGEVAGSFVDVQRSGRIVDGGSVVHKKARWGRHPNRDVYIDDPVHGRV